MDPAEALTLLRETLVSELDATFRARIVPCEDDPGFKLELVLRAIAGYWDVRVGDVTALDHGFNCRYWIDLESVPLVITGRDGVLAAARDIAHRLEAEAARFLSHQTRAKSGEPG
jgi:hypothetical protein